MKKDNNKKTSSDKKDIITTAHGTESTIENYETENHI